jgi:hypothetical protein
LHGVRPPDPGEDPYGFLAGALKDPDPERSRGILSAFDPLGPGPALRMGPQYAGERVLGSPVVAGPPATPSNVDDRRFAGTPYYYSQVARRLAEDHQANRVLSYPDPGTLQALARQEVGITARGWRDPQVFRRPDPVMEKYMMGWGTPGWGR